MTVFHQNDYDTINYWENAKKVERTAYIPDKLTLYWNVRVDSSARYMENKKSVKHLYMLVY